MEKSHSNRAWTGLKDSNGKKFYDGDIVKMTYAPQEKVRDWDELGELLHIERTEILEVRWGKYDDGECVSNIECWMVGEESLSEMLTYLATYGHDAIAKCEVIGNAGNGLVQIQSDEIKIISFIGGGNTYDNTELE